MTRIEVVKLSFEEELVSIGRRYTGYAPELSAAAIINPGTVCNSFHYCDLLMSYGVIPIRRIN